MKKFLSQTNILGIVFVVVTSILSISIISGRDTFNSIFSSLFSDNSLFVLENNIDPIDGENLLLFNNELSSQGGVRQRIVSGQKSVNSIKNFIHLKSGFFWKSHTLVFNAKKNGEVVISLSSENSRSDFGYFPILSDYSQFFINAEKIFDYRHTIRSDKPFKKKISFKKGDTIVVKLKTRRHLVRFQELKQIYNIQRYLLGTLVLIYVMIYIGLVRLIRSKKITSLNFADQFLFFCFLFIMILCFSVWSNANNSITDRRNLANQPELYLQKTLNLNFGEQYERWFQDHFNLREILLKIYRSIYFNINSYPNNGGHVEYKEWIIRPYCVDAVVSMNKNLENVDLCVDAVAALGKYLNDRNIKFYMLMVPEAWDVYQKEAAFWYNPKIISNNLNNIIKRFQQKLKIPFIYPIKELTTAAKFDYVYFKSDHHWTDYGARIAYIELINQMRKDFPDLSVTDDSNFTISKSWYCRSNWPMIFNNGENNAALLADDNDLHLLKSIYSFWDYKKNIGPEIKWKDDVIYKQWHNPNATKFKLLTFGTSFNENLNQFLPTSVSDQIFIRTNNGHKFNDSEQMMFLKHYKKLLDEFNPNAVVLCVCYANIPSLKSLMVEPE